MGYNEILLEENPKGWYGSSRRHSAAAKKGWSGRRSNPLSGNPMPTTISDFYQGVSPVDAVWALGGFAGATMLPGLIVKSADTTGKKVGKLVLALGSAGIVGLAAKSFGKTAGTAAIAGGLAGALAQGLSAFTGVVIGDKPRMLGTPAPRVPSRSIGRPVPEVPYSAESSIITNVT